MREVDGAAASAATVPLLGTDETSEMIRERKKLLMGTQPPLSFSLWVHVSHGQRQPCWATWRSAAAAAHRWPTSSSRRCIAA
jgi:hypothetical protein